MQHFLHNLCRMVWHSTECVTNEYCRGLFQSNSNFSCARQLCWTLDEGKPLIFSGRFILFCFIFFSQLELSIFDFITKESDHVSIWSNSLKPHEYFYVFDQTFYYCFYLVKFLLSWKHFLTDLSFCVEFGVKYLHKRIKEC